MNRFEGRLDGNNQVIHGLRVSLFDSSAEDEKKNLRRMFVDAGMKTEFLPRRCFKNVLFMNCISKENEYGSFGRLGKPYIGKVWLEGIDITPQN